MKKIEVLKWGVRHIADNHRKEYNTNYEDCMSMSIWDNGAPVLADARMLCEDLGIERRDCYADNSWGIICIDIEGWADTIGQQDYTPTGMEMWKRHDATIGA